MDMPLLERFRRLIAGYTGLVIPERDDPILRTKLGLRTHALHFPGMESYLNFLESGSTKSRDEWQELIRELTTVESYFFRDSGQIKLLQEVILPELIQRHRADKTLRIWSAGCASGEEPFSLAMLVEQLLPDYTNWRIFILGSDINDIPLLRAQQGSYGSWAFRGMDPEQLNRYFHKHGDVWQLDPSIREMVVFRSLNLLGDEFPSVDLADIDLIVCRNVFIYFDRSTIARVVSKFSRTLTAGGYLLTGHGEIPHPMTDILGLGPHRLIIKSFPDSIIFHRPVDETPLSTPVVNVVQKKVVTILESGGVTRKPLSTPPLKRPVMNTTPTAESVLKKAVILFEQGAYERAKSLALELLGETRLAFDVRLVLARIYANLGENQQAQIFCREALRINPIAARPYFLLAHILQEKGEDAQAVELLKKVIYLDAGHVPAYLELAAIYKRDKDFVWAKKMRQSAMNVLRSLPANARVEGYESWTAEELGRQMEILLDE